MADSPDSVLRDLPATLSRFHCPDSVRVSASRPAGNDNELDIHLVNYDRVELPSGSDGKPNLGAGIEDEKPRAVRGAIADVVLLKGKTLRAVEFLTPEMTEVRALAVQVKDGRARIEVPEFLVYGVVRLAFK